MTSLKILLLASLLTTLAHPAQAETPQINPQIQRESAKALGGEVKPSITLFPAQDDTSSRASDFQLQLSGQRPLRTRITPDRWESQLLDDQRRIIPGFFKINGN